MGDPGDETQRNFRYQHGYGVILLAAAVRGQKPYVAIWCEQHEDHLAERSDGRFDAYQIKTRKPELGTWKLSDSEVRDSIKRFVWLDVQFPGQVAGVFFVSNVECHESEAEGEVTKCPRRLAVAITAGLANLSDAWRPVFESLVAHCGCSAEQLEAVLLKLTFVRGPSRDGFESDIAILHLATVPRCASYNATELNELRDELIQQVFQASSQKLEGPEKHLCSLRADDRNNPLLLAKRIAVAAFDMAVQEIRRVPFRFLPGGPSVSLGSASSRVEILRKKLVRSGLADQLQTMQSRALSAEQHLMGRAYEQPSEIDSILDQLANVVKGECDEAKLAAGLGSSGVDGRTMLADVYRRLREIAQERPELVHYEPYETLAGIAGILTGDCIVWWGEPFDLGDGS